MSTTAATPTSPRSTRRRRKRIDWAKWILALYFVLFLAFLYMPMILMGVLSFQGPFGGLTWPFRGPVTLNWWKSLFDSSVPGSQAENIGIAGRNSLWISLAAGAIVALLAFTLSMAFRRNFRGSSVAFYVIMLALMTPGFLLALGTQLFWSFLDVPTSIWRTALGANVIWGIPFGFLIMLAVWNRYDNAIEEAARDLGANKRRTFREVTLPLVWTGIFGAFLFGATLTWNDYDRSILFQVNSTDTLPLTIGGLTFTGAIRPDLYALGTATTLATVSVVVLFLLITTIVLKFRGASSAPVRRVEEEFGEELGGPMRIEAADTDER
ncbi:MAG TPA: ABC transporter permease subunit [Gaiellaceae bacterium]|nr:ABC transporter permease subunit [Gaiellaceae bacterium]